MVSLFNVVCWTHVAEEIARGISTGASLAFWGHRSSRSQCPRCAPVIHCAKEASSRDLHVSLLITLALVVGIFFGILLCIWICGSSSTTPWRSAARLRELGVDPLCRATASGEASG